MNKQYGIILWFFTTLIEAQVTEFGSVLCHQTGYQCLKVKKHNSWSQLFPNPEQQELVKKINRNNEFLTPGMILAVPEQLEKKNLLDVSPLPLTTPTHHEKSIIINQALLAWGAYDAQGRLLRWGPISAGSKQCLEITKGCATPLGTFRLLRKKGKACFSKSFPQMLSGEVGGAYMPYCMFFYKGYALHGSESLPGYNDSHGCVRLFIQDAQWLNEHFVTTPDKTKQELGTRIVIV